MLESMAWEQFEADIWAYGSAGVGVDYYPACHVYSMDAMTTNNWIINDNQPILEGEMDTDDAGGVASAAVVEWKAPSICFIWALPSGLKTPFMMA